MSGKQPVLYPLLAGMLALLFGCQGSLPSNLSQFAPCPDAPNCVSTKATDEEHSISPISYEGTQQDARERMLEIIHSLPRAHVITEKDDYLHVEFTSRIFRFVDDVEFYFGEEAGMIHFRSASRLGHSDLGVNRKRMEEIRARFHSTGR